MSSRNELTTCPYSSSLTEDDIPTKLRCAICSKLAVNAFKLPCCEQLIDENCEYLLLRTPDSL